MLWSERLCSLPPFPCQVICWNPDPKVLVLGDRAFGKWLGQRAELLWMELVLLQKSLRKLPCSLHHVRTLRESTIYEEVGSRPHCIWQCHDLELCSLQNCEKYFSVVYKPLCMALCYCSVNRIRQLFWMYLLSAFLYFDELFRCWLQL